jgi:hypothetical protein
VAHGLGRCLPLQRIGLRLQIVCETSQAATDLIAGQQLTGKLPGTVCLRPKLPRRLTRGRFIRHFDCGEDASVRLGCHHDSSTQAITQGCDRRRKVPQFAGGWQVWLLRRSYPKPAGDVLRCYGTPCTRRGSGSRSAPWCAQSAGRRSSCRMRRLSQPFTLCPALPDATGPENDPISAARMTSGCSAPS